MSDTTTTPAPLNLYNLNRFLTGTTSTGFVGAVTHNLFIYLTAWNTANNTQKWEAVEAASSIHRVSVDSILRFAGVAL